VQYFLHLQKVVSNKRAAGNWPHREIRRPPGAGRALKYHRAFAIKRRGVAAISALFSGDKAVMKTLAVIFVLALAAIAGSVYTDELWTNAQAQAGPGELPMLMGQSHAPLGIH
jgi:hypothetical protein